MDQIVTLVSLAIAAGSLIVAYFTFQRNSKKMDTDDTKENVQIHAGLQSQIDTINAVQMTRLDAIDNGIRDLKAERRQDSAQMNKRFDEMRDEIRDIRDGVTHATELAEAAHRRLDRIGADPDSAVKK